jgi:hypothetical protein
MKTPTSVIAIFCEDIREDKSGQLSLIGILGDNVGVPPLPEDAKNFAGTIPKLFVYIRISFDVSEELGPISIRMILPNGSSVPAGNVEQKTVEQARATREKGNPVAGIVLRIQFGGPIITSLPSRMIVEVTIGSQTYIAGALRFEIAEQLATPSSIVLQPPS